MFRHFGILALCTVICLSIIPRPLAAESLYPTWKLLNSSEKQQFVAGYLHGWRDAAKIAEITVAYVKSHPDEALASLETLQSLYSVSDLKPALLAVEIDRFFSEPSNQDASLSKAVSAARSKLSARSR